MRIGCGSAYHWSLARRLKDIVEEAIILDHHIDWPSLRTPGGERGGDEIQRNHSRRSQEHCRKILWPGWLRLG